MFSNRSAVIGDLAVGAITLGTVFLFGELIGGFGAREQVLFLGGLTPLLLSAFALRRLLDHARMQEALGESAALYRELFEDANDMVYTHDLEGYFTSINKAGERLIDKPRERAVGMHISAVLSTPYHEFALDDFGVGFSSFYQLKSLDVDYLKIDGSFIQDLPNDEIDQHLVKAIVEVARALNKETIAEFVSDAETTQLLRELGVGFAQGYYIGEPRADIDPSAVERLAA